MLIGYVNVFVSDIAKAVVFYRDVLGLKVRHEDGAFGYASVDAGPVSLGLSLPGDRPELVGRHTGIGFVVEDLIDEHARLAAAGVDFTMEPSEQPWGGFMAMFKDPDGNVYYLDQPSAAH